MLRKLPLYPFLLAIWPPLALAAKNADSVTSWSEVIIPSLAGISVLFGSVAVGKWWFSSWGPAWITGALVVSGLWWFRSLVFAMTGSPVLHALGLANYAALLATGCLGGALYVVLRRLNAAASLPVPFLNIFSLLLLAPPVTTLVRGGIGGHWSVAIGSRPQPVDAPLPEAPDIYVILVDGYGRHHAGPGSVGSPQSEFEHALRTRGFAVPPHAAANYLWTHLALASMLNGASVQDLPVWSPEHLTTPEPVLDSLIAGSRLLHRFLGAGYEFVFAPSSFRPFHSHPWADRRLNSEWRPPAGAFALHWPRQTPLPELRRLWCRVFPCTPRAPWTPESADDFRTKFEQIGSVKRAGRPMLVFAHLMLPHEPFVFHADCKPREEAPWPHVHHMEESPEVVQYYRAQVNCLNRGNVPIAVEK